MADPEPRSSLGSNTIASSQAQAAALRRLSARAKSSSRQRNTSHHQPMGSSSSCCFSFAAYARSLMDHLRRCGIQVAPGLSDDDFSRLESSLGIVFPPDLRAILSEGLPLSDVDDRFPDWRSASIPHLRARCDAPVAAICREVARGRFWCRRRWGERPATSDAAASVAAAAIRAAPRLIPIYGKCYIPSSSDAGNPILTVHGSDVACCGNDVADFFERESFLSPQQRRQPRHSNCDSDEAAATSSCLSSLIGGRTSIDAIANPLLGSWRKGQRRLLTTSRSLEASPRPSVSSSGGSCSDPPRRSVDVASLLRRRSSLGRKNTASQAAAAAATAAVAVAAQAQPSQQRIDALLGFTIPAPAWAAKAPRRVDVWSDLVDLCSQGSTTTTTTPTTIKQQQQQQHPSISWEASREDRCLQGYDLKQQQQSTILREDLGSQDYDFTIKQQQRQQLSTTWDVPREDLVRRLALSPKKLPVAVESSTEASMPPAEGPGSVAAEPPTKWLDGYLHDMAGRLRTAGWKEDDICEMMVPASTSSSIAAAAAAAAAAIAAAAVVADSRVHHHVVEEDQQQAAACSRQAVIRDLALKVGQLSDSLKRAGWSVQDVAEALGCVSSTPSSGSFVYQQQQHRSSSLTTSSIVTAR